MKNNRIFVTVMLLVISFMLYNELYRAFLITVVSTLFILLGEAVDILDDIRKNQNKVD